MIFQRMSDGSVRRKPISDADPREQIIKKLNSVEKALLAIISKTVSTKELTKYQSPLKKVREAVAKDRDKLLGK